MPMNEIERLNYLDGKKILLIVTGGIAAYKICSLIRELKRLNSEVKVIATKSACEFITPLTYSTLSGNPVYNSLFPKPDPAKPIHLDLSEWADLLVAAPATANFIAKISHGIADDLASTVAMAFDGKILAAPAMNPKMWNNPAVKENVQALKTRGISLVGPEEGEMAGIDEKPGVGRMSEPDKILNSIEYILADKTLLAGKKVLVTSGATRESIDPVRFISNNSSGMMGAALARQARLRGAGVILVKCKGAVNPNLDGINVIEVISAKDMADAVKAQFAQIDMLIMAAAVSDWTVGNIAGKKIKKKDGAPDLKLEKTEDILAWVGSECTNQVIVGFALETNDHFENAQKKIKEKNIDIIALNDPTQTHSAFGGDTTRLTLIARDGGVKELPFATKRKAADLLLEFSAQLLN